jgi:hypothetical protein
MQGDRPGIAHSMDQAIQGFRADPVEYSAQLAERLSSQHFDVHRHELALPTNHCSIAISSFDSPRGRVTRRACDDFQGSWRD